MENIFMITGATDGIGLHTACKLASVADVLILHGRNPVRLEAAVRQVQAQSSSLKVHTVLGDLSSILEVRDIARQVISLVPYLNCLINNAGVFSPNYQLSKDGVELTFAVNVLAPYLLTSLLKDLLLKAKNPRLINTSSISQSSSVPGEYQLHESNYSKYEAYAQSKLFDVMLTMGQAVDLPDVIVVSLDSGTVNTKMLCSRLLIYQIVLLYSWILAVDLPDVVVVSLDPGTVNTKMLLAGWGECGIPVSQADDTYWLATTQEVDLSNSGDYFNNRIPRKKHPVSRNHILELFQYLDNIIQEKS
ncbi:short-chain dehydrogenase TIC 32, chloroplastic-like [Eurytemora carolleeae]|uniref:short-chain dehydrogenase TIC 32, chloroplastic-like n=1 Tax=Eurytemora carolleeae TaxID=1294199 RepID=UPI000C766B89|nr:short-chain dehydrogenase TIC 32, chloroplastic-like [Eurytemora carolleeae]|eukprot:XP_023342358.1 short-chain dehydrogenase TIC 32, chloroplastic-like [Eurytemora affinis]